MPRIGVICDVSGERITDADCLACAHSWGKQIPKGGGAPRHCNYNYPYIHAWLHPYDRSKAGISTTNITGHCTRKAWYEKTLDYYQAPSQAHAAMDGTSYHEMMDRHIEEEAIAEQRLVKRWRYRGVWREITGQMDYYRPDLGLLGDYKAKNSLFSRPPDEYIAQLNIYAWMIRTGCAFLETGERLQGEVQQMVLFPKTHMGQLCVEVPLWTIHQTEHFVNAVYTHFEQAQQGKLPPRGFDSSTEKFCRDWCPFRQQCIEDDGPIQRPPYHVERLIPANLREVQF